MLPYEPGVIVCVEVIFVDPADGNTAGVGKLGIAGNVGVPIIFPKEGAGPV